MAISLIALCPVTPLTTSALILYTCPASTKVIIKRVSATNIDTVARTYTVYKVPAGATPGVGNAVVFAKSVAANEDQAPTSLTNLVLSPGDMLQAVADAAAKVNFSASGILLT